MVQLFNDKGMFIYSAYTYRAKYKCDWHAAFWAFHLKLGLSDNTTD